MRKLWIIFLLPILVGCGVTSHENYSTTNEALEVVEICNRRFLRTFQSVYLINEDYHVTLTEIYSGSHSIGGCDYEVYLNNVWEN